MPSNKKILFSLPRTCRPKPWRRLVALATWGVFFFLFSFLLPLTALAVTGFKDPLDGATVESALINLIWVMLGFVGLLAIGGIIYGGIRIIAGLGNQSSVESGKKAIFWSVGGLILVALSAIIVGIVANALGVAGAP